VFFIPLLSCVKTDGEEGKPEGALLRFGVIADVQYADIDNKGSRRYREAAEKLREAIAALNQHRLDFIVDVGDKVEGMAKADLPMILEIYQSADAPVHHVVGNHDFWQYREKDLQDALSLNSLYYSFTVNNIRCIVLYAHDVSTGGKPKDDPRVIRGIEYMESDKSRRDAEGALSDAQLAWLDRELADAASTRQYALLFCHVPLLAAASTDVIRLWNADAVLELLDRHRGTPLACFCGHFHPGGFGERAGIGHFTMKAMCDAPTGGNAYSIVEVHADRIQVTGFGEQPSRVITIERAQQ
jgi:3',5'-cyclic AMP phosphodiesterase CpdA